MRTRSLHLLEQMVGKNEKKTNGGLLVIYHGRIRKKSVEKKQKDMFLNRPFYRGSMKSNLEVLCKPHKPRYVNVEKGLSKNSPAFEFHGFLAFRVRVVLNVLFLTMN